MVEAKQTSLEISKYKDIEISCYKNCNPTSRPISIYNLAQATKKFVIKFQQSVKACTNKIGK